VGARRESQTTVDKFVEHGVEVGLVSLALAQHAVFSLEQVTDLGVTRQAVAARVGAGRLHRVHHGVYSLVPPQLLTLEGRYMAAVLACGPGAALSVRSAAQLLGLRATDRSRIEVTVPTPGGRRRPGIQVHRSRTLRAGDITVVRNIPCTTVARTIFDLADVVNRRGVERAIDQAEAEEVLDVTALREQIAHNAGRSKPARVLTAVLDEHEAGATVTWSVLEELVLATSRAAGFPDPETNAWVDLRDGEPMIRADFLWRELRVIVEADGFKTHGTRRSFESDRRRDQRAKVAGFDVVRVTERQLRRERRRIAQTIAAVLSDAAAARRDRAA
jgi:predicted transcriptional regulator of viral defense system